MQVLGTRAGLGVLLSPLGTNLPPMAFQGELAQKLKPLREKEQDKILDLKKKVRREARSSTTGSMPRMCATTWIRWRRLSTVWTTIC